MPGQVANSESFFARFTFRPADQRVLVGCPVALHGPFENAPGCLQAHPALGADANPEGGVLGLLGCLRSSFPPGEIAKQPVGLSFGLGCSLALSDEALLFLF